jgi:1-aminocyclopropane-1-carboxylate deaminase/D-cysteine desulfhydrase-like pyridoxal-dependent ACC family enzyme
MRRLSQFIARLYPRSWRERYGAEFFALLEDVGADWQTSADILKGALEMQIRAVGLVKILLAVGLAGTLTAMAARYAIPQRTEAVVTVSGPTDDDDAGDAVMSAATGAFKHMMSGSLG